MEIALRITAEPALLLALHSIADSLAAIAARQVPAVAQPARDDILRGVVTKGDIEQPSEAPTSPPQAVPAEPGVSSPKLEPAGHEPQPASFSEMYEAMARASQANAARAPKRGTPYTPERIAIIEARYPKGDSVKLIATECNGLPGPMVSAEALGVWCSTRGLKRGSAVTIPSARPAEVARKASEPVRASKEAIHQWGALRGVDGPFNIDRINRKAEQLGHPGFLCT